MLTRLALLFSIVFALISNGTSALALTFEFRPAPGMSAESLAAFKAAGKLWSDRLTDDATVVIDIDFKKLAQGVLGSTGSEKITVDYTSFRTAIGQSMSVVEASTTMQHFPAGPTTPILINFTRNSPHGNGNATVFLDNDGDDNNKKTWLTRANAKALGLLPKDDPAPDAAIAFSTEFNWDFDPSDGIKDEHFSFIAVAAHEIGHALGFVSGVDILDGNSGQGGDPGPFDDNVFAFVSPADVLRRSNKSLAEGPTVIDWAADTRDKFFALGAATNGDGGFSTGRKHGDGQQASHWKDNLSLGLMDPTIGRGVHNEISELDLALFNAVGYERVVLVAGNNAVTSKPKLISDTEMTFTADQPGQAEFLYSASPQDAIMELRYSGGIIENPDPTPFVRVFGDGTVRVHYPKYMKKAGDYSYKLSQEELEKLVSKFSNDAVADTPMLNLEDRLQTEQPSGPVEVVGNHDVRAEVTLSIERIDPVDPAKDFMSNVKRHIEIPTDKVFEAARSSDSPVSVLASGIKALEGLASDVRLQAE